jgi:hypothetical protein
MQVVVGALKEAGVLEDYDEEDQHVSPPVDCKLEDSRSLNK